ncbi:MAG TPA: hypothetical protein VFQ44_06105 [Streptosporangiaceae bacterium]|nr:hypothetical protein [Streptosporangiaceae bacterium]
MHRLSLFRGERRITSIGITAVILALGASAALATWGSATAAQPSATTAKTITTRVPGAPDCPMFPANNIWNTDISKLPVDSHSAAWLRGMDAAHTLLHPDFGPSGGYPYGIPYTIVDNSHNLVRIKFRYGPQSDKGPYPFGADTKIEGGKNAGGDRHALIVNKKTCMLYELDGARFSGHPTAISGAIWDLRSNALRPAGWTSADAAGLPILPGLLNFKQVEYSARTGKPITHAIRFTAEMTRTSFIWPARHEAGHGSSRNLPPMGARFRLKASFNVRGFCRNSAPYCKDAKAVLIEMQHYGLILADNGSNWYFQGAAFPQWPDDLVSLLKGIPASAFQAVDTSCLMVSRNSGAVKAKPGCRIG